MKTVLSMRRAAFAAVAVWALAAASPAFAGISNFAIDRDAALAADDLHVTVTGTVECPVGETRFISVQVFQVHGQEFTDAFGFSAGIACTGTVAPWTVLTTVALTPMKDGPATAAAFAFAFGPGTFESASTTSEVHVRH